MDISTSYAEDILRQHLSAIDSVCFARRFLHNNGLQELDVYSVVGGCCCDAVSVRRRGKEGPHRYGCGESIPGWELHGAP